MNNKNIICKILSFVEFFPVRVIAQRNWIVVKETSKVERNIIEQIRGPDTFRYYICYKILLE